METFWIIFSARTWWQKKASSLRESSWSAFCLLRPMNKNSQGRTQWIKTSWGMSMIMALSNNSWRFGQQLFQQLASIWDWERHIWSWRETLWDNLNNTGKNWVIESSNDLLLIISNSLFYLSIKKLEPCPRNTNHFLSERMIFLIKLFKCILAFWKILPRTRYQEYFLLLPKEYSLSFP